MDRVRHEPFHEGLSAQIMHTGSYSAEISTVATLHEFISVSGCTLSGRHHEIHLGDPGRAKPESMKTIIRQPVRSVSPPTH